MADNAKLLRDAIGNALMQHGFQPAPQKGRVAWYLSRPEIVLVFDLQKSDFGGQYAANLGVCLKALCSSDCPLEELCHLRVRLDRLVTDRETVLKVLDLENPSVPGKPRAQLLDELIQKIAIPWFDRFKTAKSFASELRNSEFLMNRATLQLKRELKLAS